MKSEDIIKRIDQLILQAENVLANSYSDSYRSYVDNEPFQQFKVSSISFLKNIFVENHPYYKEFIKNVTDANPEDVRTGRAILNSVKDEIVGGWMFTFKGLVSAEIFSDFLEMADYLLNEKYKDAAAVMIGSVLEEHIRQLCKKFSVDIVTQKMGKDVPKKADLLNADLVKAGAYNLLDQKNITSWLEIRNNAAHGKHLEFSIEQVELMYQGVTNFISRTT